MPNLTISPDSKKIVFIRSVDKTRTSQLISAEIEEKSEKIIYETEQFKRRDFFRRFCSRWKNACRSRRFSDEMVFIRKKLQIIEMPAEGGELKVIWQGEEENTGFASSPQWLA